jgi:primosomal protein N'
MDLRTLPVPARRGARSGDSRRGPDRGGYARDRLLSVPTRVSARITQLKLPAKQLHALKILAASPEPLTAQQLAAAARCTLAPIHQLRDKGLIEIQMRRVQTTEVAERTEDPDSRRPLNRDQQQALDAIRRC